ncbi:RICIN domain-containing protein [Actinokineospora inagensis]|uniref:RICIN domain-containing protein n=1 Tax=Actinokineospora inagensis TaxID=103730 RepID=UPI00040D2A14|nr:RICIN domain-containing protein [Actinokineospora inagensis]
MKIMLRWTATFASTLALLACATPAQAEPFRYGPYKIASDASCLQLNTSGAIVVKSCGVDNRTSWVFTETANGRYVVIQNTVTSTCLAPATVGSSLAPVNCNRLDSSQAWLVYTRDNGATMSLRNSPDSASSCLTITTPNAQGTHTVRLQTCGSTTTVNAAQSWTMIPTKADKPHPLP